MGNICSSNDTTTANQAVDQSLRIRRPLVVVVPANDASAKRRGSSLLGDFILQNAAQKAEALCFDMRIFAFKLENFKKFQGEDVTLQVGIQDQVKQASTEKDAKISLSTQDDKEDAKKTSSVEKACLTFWRTEATVLSKSGDAEFDFENSQTFGPAKGTIAKSLQVEILDKHSSLVAKVSADYNVSSIKDVQQVSVDVKDDKENFGVLKFELQVKQRAIVAAKVENPEASVADAPNSTDVNLTKMETLLSQIDEVVKVESSPLPMVTEEDHYDPGEVCETERDRLEFLADIKPKETKVTVSVETQTEAKESKESGEAEKQGPPAITVDAVDPVEEPFCAKCVLNDFQKSIRATIRQTVKKSRPAPEQPKPKGIVPQAPRGRGGRGAPRPPPPSIRSTVQSEQPKLVANSRISRSEVPNMMADYLAFRGGVEEKPIVRAGTLTLEDELQQQLSKLKPVDAEKLVRRATRRMDKSSVSSKQDAKAQLTKQLNAALIANNKSNAKKMKKSAAMGSDDDSDDDDDSDLDDYDSESDD